MGPLAPPLLEEGKKESMEGFSSSTQAVLKSRVPRSNLSGSDFPDLGPHKQRFLQVILKCARVESLWCRLYSSAG
jgi:hypothetical protein